MLVVLRCSLFPVKFCIFRGKLQMLALWSCMLLATRAKVLAMEEEERFVVLSLIFFC
jgi:hypothetical protein